MKPNKQIKEELVSDISNSIKFKENIGFNGSSVFIESNHKSVPKKRKEWEKAITSDIAEKYWTNILNNKFHLVESLKEIRITMLKNGITYDNSDLYNKIDSIIKKIEPKIS